MKKLVTLLFVMLVIGSVFSQDVVITHTKTTTEAEFSAIKTACHEDGNLMKYYYDLPGKINTI